MRIALMLILFLLLPAIGFSQDDTPWWKKLFKKETVEELEKEAPETPTQPSVTFEAPDSIATPATTKDAARDTTPGIARLDREGDIRLERPRGLEKLDSAFKSTPPAIQGFRIQIYFGGLQEARETRAGFLKEVEDYTCYLEQNPPNFTVQVGDFRTHLDAYRALLQIKGEYPSSLIVPAEIQPPKPPKADVEDE